MFTFGSRHASENSVRVRFAGHNCSKIWLAVSDIFQEYQEASSWTGARKWMCLFFWEGDLAMWMKSNATKEGIVKGC